jgi:Lrp/AsnC family leucine-responsive transcriptional regulator
MAHLEQLIGRINLYGETRTSIVMSTPLAPRGLARPPSKTEGPRG